MAELILPRASALEGHVASGHYGLEDQTGVVFEECKNLVLFQIAAWPDSLSRVSALATDVAGAPEVPGPGKAIAGDNATLLRIEPLKFWMLGSAAPELRTEEGATLDLSHSRTHLKVSGVQAATLLNRFLPLDFREASFQPGSVASTAFHHVGITLWRSEAGYEMFLPRGFALSLWELLRDGAAQFGYDIVTEENIDD
jgi:methylglutamate dehydrogenase subunit D